jgi:hypothetical protein
MNPSCTPYLALSTEWQSSPKHMVKALYTYPTAAYSEVATPLFVGASRRPGGGEAGIQIFGLLWLVAAVGFVVAGAIVLLPDPWWRPLAIE